MYLGRAHRTALTPPDHEVVDHTISPLDLVNTNDARVGAVRGRRNTDAVTAYEDVVRLIEGNAISIALVQSAGELQFTISHFPTFKPPQASTTFFGSATVNHNPAFTNYALFVFAIANATSGGTDQQIAIGGCVGSNTSDGIVGQGCVHIDGIGGTEKDGYTEGKIIDRSDNPGNSFFTVTTMTKTNIVLTKGGTVPGQIWGGRLFAIGY